MSDTSKYLSPLVSCLECRKEYPSKGIFKHLLNTHDKIKSKNTGKGIDKFTVRICCLICKHETTTGSFSRHLDSHNKIIPEKICPKCNTSHFKSGTFCSYKCSCSKIQTTESNLKRSNTLKLNALKNPNPPKTLICKNCNITFNSKKFRKTCSPECAQILQTLGRIKGGVKGGKRSAELQCRRSKDEIELFNLCDEYFINVTNNDTSIANGWDADILIHEHKIAILWNGPWHYKEMGFSNHSLKQVQNRDKIKTQEFQKAGWSVEIYEDRYYTPTTAFIDLKSKLNQTR